MEEGENKFPRPVEDFTPPNDPEDTGEIAPGSESGDPLDDLRAVLAGSKPATFISGALTLEQHLSLASLLEKAKSQRGLTVEELDEGDGRKSYVVGSPDRVQDILEANLIKGTDTDEIIRRENLMGRALGYPQTHIDAHIARRFAQKQAIAENPEISRDEINQISQEAYDEALKEGQARAQEREESKPAVEPDQESEERSITTCLGKVEQCLFPEIIEVREKRQELDPHGFLTESVLRQLLYTIANRHIKQKGETSLEGFEDRQTRQEAIAQASSRLAVAAKIIEGHRQGNVTRDREDEDKYRYVVKELKFVKHLLESGDPNDLARWFLASGISWQDKEFFRDHLNEINIIMTADSVDHQKIGEGSPDRQFLPKENSKTLEYFVTMVKPLGFQVDAEGLLLPQESVTEEGEQENRYLSAFEPYRDAFLAKDQEHRDQLNRKVEEEIGFLEQALGQLKEAEEKAGGEEQIIKEVDDKKKRVDYLGEEIRWLKKHIEALTQNHKESGGLKRLISGRGMDREIENQNQKLSQKNQEKLDLEAQIKRAEEKLEDLRLAKDQLGQLKNAHGGDSATLAERLRQAREAPRH